MFLKIHSSEDRLRIWREIRQKEYSKPEELVKEFVGIKVRPRYIDYYTPSSWPNPFEILTEEYLCYSGITLILASTLIHKGFITSDNLFFPVISNNITNEYGIVLLDNEKVYNFTQGKIEDWEYVKENATIFQTHLVSKKDILY